MHYKSFLSLYRIPRQDFSYDTMKFQFHRVFEFHPRDFFFFVGISSSKNDIIKNIVSQKSGEKIGYRFAIRNHEVELDG